MTNLVKAELLRLVRRRAFIVLVLVAVVANAVTMAGNAGSADPSVAGHNAVFQLAFGAVLFSMILGVLASTAEFQCSSAGRTILLVGSACRLIVAKLIASLAAGVAFGAVTTLTGLLTASVALDANGQHLAITTEVVYIACGIAAIVAIGVPWGAMVGWIVRDQMTAVVGLVAWTVIVESALQAVVPQVSRWLPGGAQSAVSLDADFPDRLGPWAGVLVLLSWLTLAAILAGRETRRREVY